MIMELETLSRRFLTCWLGNYKEGILSGKVVHITSHDLKKEKWAEDYSAKDTFLTSNSHWVEVQIQNKRN